MRAEIDAAIREVLDTSAFAGGPFVARFEEEFAAFCGARHAVGVGNGTDALWLSLLALGVGPGDDVITVAQGSSAEQVIRDATDLTASVAPWLQADHEALTGKILKLPERSEIDTPVQESLIVELYSK